ncbi:MAG: hypothetical protein JJ974_09590 [Phycisphaerales bacterium]|nr:hypothetical protein [Phycisphaerales bacterium]
MGLDSVELVMECEDHFKIVISDEDASKTYTVGELHELCVRLVERTYPEFKMDDAQRAAMFHQVRMIVSEQLGVRYERTVPEARFIEDLKMDQ